MKIRMSQFTKEYIIKEFDITQEVLDEWEVTLDDVKGFVENPDEFDVENDYEKQDVMREMFQDLEYDIYDEGTHDDGEEWLLVE